MTDRLDWVGSFLGMSGALLLSINADTSHYGWLLFLASNIAWFFYGVNRQLWSVVFMQAAFMSTSILGVYRWIL